MKVYYYDNQSGDQRLPHDSGETLTPSDLLNLGVLSYHFPNVDDPTAINDLASSRSYKNRDVITVSPDAMGDIYEDKVKGFFHEHLHEDEEIRYILDGAGYFDCRAKDEKWVRILLEKGDLIVMPAGIYHRFTTDENNVSGYLLLGVFYFLSYSFFLLSSLSPLSFFTSCKYKRRVRLIC